MLAFDLETTGVDTDTARVVTAACITVGPGGVLNRRTWLADPGVVIPDEAAAIHGVTTERARAEGRPAAEVVEAVATAVRIAWQHPAIPVVAMNGCYDLSVMQAELNRHGLPLLEIGPVLDPLVVDRAVDKYRKGSRKLDALAAHYGVRLDKAHASDEDALTAARVVWRQARHPQHGKVLRMMTLDEMQDWQAKAHAAWAANYQDYLRTKAEPRQVDAVVDGSWPVRPVVGAAA
jgi:DNA polymerase-3 subunit epsilon